MAFLGIPGAGEAQARQDMYAQQQKAQDSQFMRQRALAQKGIASSVGTAMGTTGNVNTAGRLVARQAGRVQGDLANQEAAAAQSLKASQMQHEQRTRDQELATQRGVFGGLISGAAQALGTAIPAFGVANGALGGAMGSSSAQGGGVGGIAQAMMGGGGPGQAPSLPGVAAPPPAGTPPAPGAPPGAPPAAPGGGGGGPLGGLLGGGGGGGPLGGLGGLLGGGGGPMGGIASMIMGGGGGGAAAPQAPPAPAAQPLAPPPQLGGSAGGQMTSPTGTAETFEERMRRLQLGGGFLGAGPMGGG